MGLWHRNREPQPQQRGTGEPLADLNVTRPQPEEAKTGSRPRRRRLSGGEAENSTAQPQPAAKAHRRSLAISETDAGEPLVESQSQPESQRPRLAQAAVAPEEQESGPKPGRSRGAITHPCDYLPEVQSIVDPPHSAADEPAQAPRDNTPDPQPSAKSGRRSVGIGRIDCDEQPSEPQAEPGPRRARLTLDTPAVPEESPSTPRPGHSRGAITHPCDDPPGLQNIIDPPQSISNEPAPVSPDQTPPPQSSVDPAQVRQFVEQFVAEQRAKQNTSMALVGGLAVAIIAATAWALVAVATNHETGWMAVGVGFLVGGAIRTLGRGIDRSFGYLGVMLSVFGCLLGTFLSVCAIIAGQESLSLVAVLTHVCGKPAVIPAAMIAAFHPLNPLFYGIAIYEGYRFSFRQVTEAEIRRALGRE